MPYHTYNTKNRLHFSSQDIEFNAECDDPVLEILTYTGTSLFCSSFLLSDHTARITVQHRLERQRCHKIQCQLKQSLVAGLAIQPELK